MLIYIVVSRERNVIKRVAGKIFRKNYNRVAAYAEYKNETHTSDNRGTWNHLNIIQKISQPHTLKT
jgi:hypothetical protein